MASVDRICANCGTVNPIANSRCSNCGTNLINLPALRDETRLPVLKSPGVLAIALGASALIARVGVQILTRAIAPAVWKLAKRAVKPKVPDSPAATDDEKPDVVIRGWRAWSVRSGEKHSSGEERFEWKVKSKKN
jgi:hypothetical protein